MSSTIVTNLNTYFPNRPAEVIDELIEYEKDLNILADAEVSIQFTNKGPDHAVLVMSKIFTYSHSHIRIFARDFNGDISDNPLYLQSLRNFLEKADTKVNVIFEKNPNPVSKAMKLLKETQKNEPDKVSLKKATPARIAEFKEYLANAEKMIHFTIGNDPKQRFNKYRCETDTDNYIAVLNFDDIKFCQKLEKLYDILNTDSIHI